MGKTSEMWNPKGYYKFAILVLLLTQFLRLFGIMWGTYKHYEAVTQKKSPGAFEPGSGNETSVTGTYEEENRNTDADWISVAVPSLEALTSCVLIVSFMGPLSQGIPILKWLVWMARLRITWMRLLWTVTASVYVSLYRKYRNIRSDSLSDVDKDSEARIAMYCVTVFEYATLGFLECVIKVYTVDRLEGRLAKAYERMPSIWGKLTVGTFLLCTLTYAVRNFSMSLYFGMLSAFVTQAEQSFLEGQHNIEPYAIFNVIIVLQIYLALMRGKYFNFFLKLCLGYILSEEEDFKFQTDDERDEERKANRKQIVIKNQRQKYKVKNEDNGDKPERLLETKLVDEV